MRRFFATVGVAGLLAAVPASAAHADNPFHHTGPPSQDCVAVVNGGGTEPGHTASSPGSPFNEVDLGGSGGTGGANYSESSQYDAACFVLSN